MRLNKLVLFIIIVLGLSFAKIANVNITTNMIKEKCEGIDSVRVVVLDVITKEMGRVHDKPYKKKLGSFGLGKNEIKMLSQHLKNSKNYNESKALLTHYNVVFKFYKKGQLVLRVIYSTYTGNMFICTENLIDDTNLDDFGDCFYENISFKFEEKIKQMFKNYEIATLIDSALWRNYYTE